MLGVGVCGERAATGLNSLDVGRELDQIALERAELC